MCLNVHKIIAVFILNYYWDSYSIFVFLQKLVEVPNQTFGEH